ncbi:HDOD domain-containing protein [Candidatus Sumerlaeota bacterium]|nr:HDOD domain-containing protein [Candidatus Sumerlaeota bacterium]
MTGQATSNDALLARLAKATGDLPAMPAVVERVLRLSQDPDTNVEHLRSAIEIDPGLTSKLLRVANSAYYARQRKITSLSQAIVTLGFKTILSLTMAGSSKTIFEQYSDVARAVRTTLYDHSISTAFLTNSLIRLTPLKMDPEICFLGGLLHDIGKLVISRNFPMQFNKVRVANEEQGVDWLEAEMATLGFDHEQLGEHLARQWNLPQQYEDLIRHHHTVAEAEVAQAEAALVNLADHVATYLGWNFPRPHLPPITESPVLGFLRVDPARLEQRLDEMREAVETIKALF